MPIQENLVNCSITRRITKHLKIIFNQFGIDISRSKNNPEITLLGLRRKPIDTIIDIGANSGQFARRISVLFPHARIYSFEPLPEPFARLLSWAAGQGARVIAINRALGPRTEQITMNLHSDHTASSSILNTTEKAGKIYPETLRQSQVVIQQITLDDAMALENLGGCLLIKMDVQGYEDRVILGGENVFSQAYACITEIALDELYQGQSTFKNILLAMDQLGFEYAGNMRQVYGEDGHCIYLDAVFIRRPI